MRIPALYELAALMIMAAAAAGALLVLAVHGLWSGQPQWPWIAVSATLAGGMLLILATMYLFERLAGSVPLGWHWFMRGGVALTVLGAITVY